MESYSTTEKLNNFTALVLRDAQTRRNKILNEVEKEYSERIGEEEKRIMKSADAEAQTGRHKAQREANERVLHTQLEARKKLIAKREEIIESVMAEAKARLEVFSKSGEYGHWLTERARYAMSELGEGSKTVYIRAADMGFEDAISALEEDITVAAARENGFLGGVKVTNTDRRIAVDYSFGEMLSAEKQKFLRSSGLSIE